MTRKILPYRHRRTSLCSPCFPTKSWKRASRFIASAAAVAAVALSAERAAAQATATWTGGDGMWSTASSWDSGIVPNSGTTSVFIDGGNIAPSIVMLDRDASRFRLTYIFWACLGTLL